MINDCEITAHEADMVIRKHTNRAEQQNWIKLIRIQQKILFTFAAMRWGFRPLAAAEQECDKTCTGSLEKKLTKSHL